MTLNRPDLSIIVPVYNEENVIKSFTDHLLNELEYQNQLNEQEDREYSYTDYWNAMERADEEAHAEEMAMLPNKYEQLAMNAGFIA